MLIENDDLKDEFQIESSLERKKILLLINGLKDSDSEVNAAIGFWELRALNRKMVDYSTPLLTTAPRWAITTFDDYPSYCKPAKELGEGQHYIIGWLEWLLM